MRERKTISARWNIRLVRKVAHGGMGDVYEGRLQGVEGFEKKVAVKMLRDRFGGDERFMEMFVAEAKLVCDLVHENIVQIHQLGRLRSGEFYIIMEFVNGLSLRAFLDRHIHWGRRVPCPLAVHLASRVARGLAYAHEFRDRTGRRLHIVHRDVCPSNILITTEGLAKLTDFGVAKAWAMPRFGDQWLAGKIRYMAPEQAACRTVDFRSDIYALGAVLFELLAQTPIRPDEADPSKVSFAEIPVPWERLPEGTDPGVLEVLRIALDPDPDHRFSNSNEMGRALEYCIYKDGYGPTIQAVESYLRQHFPDFYIPNADPMEMEAPQSDPALAETVIDPDRTSSPDRQ